MEVFDLFALPAWAQQATAEGRLTAERPLEIEVRHPDREMDGSCRWYGCRDNEIVVMSQ
ncbi:MAG: hypothetical protein AB7J35_12010 [Dehalococcoidia bacterium]